MCSHKRGENGMCPREIIYTQLIQLEDGQLIAKPWCVAHFPRDPFVTLVEGYLEIKRVK